MSKPPSDKPMSKMEHRWYNWQTRYVCRFIGHKPIRITDFTIVDPICEWDDREEFDQFSICKRCLVDIHDGSTQFNKWSKI